VIVPSGIRELIVGMAVAFGLTVVSVSVMAGVMSIMW
jgi:hypothetical protein